MVIIHIQEANSDQVTEVTAKDIKTAIRAYAENAASNWSELRNHIMYYHNNEFTKGVRCATFYFRTEKLTISNVYSNRYMAVWTNS